MGSFNCLTITYFIKKVWFTWKLVSFKQFVLSICHLSSRMNELLFSFVSCCEKS